VNRALVTFAVGSHAPLLEESLPAMGRYADQHGYDLISRPPAMLLRPPSWHKITAVLTALDTYDEVLWIDADVLVLDDSLDLADEVDDGAWQAITRHHTREGEIPSVGVWLVREPMRTSLEKAWQLVGAGRVPAAARLSGRPAAVPAC
jgi:galactosyl transferase GMA12/MNN10 family